MGDLTLFEALTGGAFDRLNWQYSGEFDQNFSKKSNARGFARGGGGMGGFGIDWRISAISCNARVSISLWNTRNINIKILLLLKYYSYIFHVHFPQTEPSKQEQNKSSISIENYEIQNIL